MKRERRGQMNQLTAPEDRAVLIKGNERYSNQAATVQKNNKYVKDIT